MAEEGHGDERGDEEQGGAAVEEEPGEVGGGGAGGFFEEARVAREEEDVEDEVEGEGAEVEEGGYEAPELFGSGTSASCFQMQCAGWGWDREETRQRLDRDVPDASRTPGGNYRIASTDSQSRIAPKRS